MVVEEVVSNMSGLVMALTPEVAERIGGLITVLKAIGIVFIFYLVYMVVMGYIAFRRIKRMRHIEKKVDSIDKKLGLLLKKKKSAKKSK